MSREIKFRAWSNEHNNYCDFITYEYKWVGWFDTNGVYLTTKDIILEQYTGLKDKNGKEIYEGDIVKMTCRVDKDESILYKVVWDDFLTGYDLINLDRSKADVGYLTKYNIKKHFEVIGNIHENPELLEKGE